MDFWATPEATQKLLSHLNCDFGEMAKRLHIDLYCTAAPRYAGPPIPEGQDMWGLKHRQIAYADGVYSEVANAPLAEFKSVQEIELNYNWPTADDWDYSHIAEDVKGNEHLPVRASGSEVYIFYKMLRGEEQAFVDMVANPDIVHYCVGKIFDYFYNNALRVFESIPGQVHVTNVSEDLGGQQGLMYSPKHIREFLLPGMKRMMELARQNGTYVFTHSDGAVRDILPDLIEIGTNILNPVQWRCEGMDREGLKRDFGDKLVFHGAVDNQYTLPFGTVEEVRREVIDNIRILGEGGGYIIAPCHNIQSVGPPENVVAMYETGYECGWTWCL